MIRILLISLCLVTISHGAETEIFSKDQTLWNACKIVARVNQKDQKLLEDYKGLTGLTYLSIELESAKGNENWKGVGAYRKTSYQGNLGDIQHHFAHGSNDSPHEFYVVYKKTDNGYRLDRIWIIGW